MDHNALLQPFRLGIQFVERVWGRDQLEPWYHNPLLQPVGEVWLTGESCLVETGPYAGKRLSQMDLEFRAALLGEGHLEFPLLVKLLFPQEKLSVQVHPDDEQAIALGGGARAKTECWYILAAEEGASVSLGLKPGTTKGMVQDALGNVKFEDLLHAEPVGIGDMVYVEAGTVHAIGPGLVILEIQQSSDTTYRLYDYGRARELHLEHATRVIKMKTNSGKVKPRTIDYGVELISVEHFVVERFDLGLGEKLAMFGNGTPQCLVALGGDGYVMTGDTSIGLVVGHATVVPACCTEYSVGGPCSVLRCGLNAAQN